MHLRELSRLEPLNPLSSLIVSAPHRTKSPVHPKLPLPQLFFGFCLFLTNLLLADRLHPPPHPPPHPHLNCCVPLQTVDSKRCLRLKAPPTASARHTGGGSPVSRNLFDFFSFPSLPRSVSSWSALAVTERSPSSPIGLFPSTATARRVDHR